MRLALVALSLLVNGDSLAEGTRPYIPQELPEWQVRQSTKVSRHASEGADVMRRYGRRLPRVIHVSLGTNDDPSQAGAFRAAVGEVMDVAGGRRCVVWANIVRPAVRRRELPRLQPRARAGGRAARQPPRPELGPHGPPPPRVALGRRRARVGRGLPGACEGGRPGGPPLPVTRPLS